MFKTRPEIVRGLKFDLNKNGMIVYELRDWYSLLEEFEIESL